MTQYLQVWPLGPASGTVTARPGGSGTCMRRIRLLADWHDAGRAGGAHHAQDIFAPEGTEVRAPIAGLVEFSGLTPNGGYNMRIRDRNKTVQLSHFAIPPRVAAGVRVAAGEVVGFVGNTGTRASRTCPHLHIGARVRGTPVNLYSDLVELMPAEVHRPQALATREVVEQREPRGTPWGSWVMSDAGRYAIPLAGALAFIALMNTPKKDRRIHV